MPTSAQRPPLAPAGVAFVLSGLGFHASQRFRARLAPLGLAARHVGLLTALAGAEGMSQQALGQHLEVPPSRMVGLVDELEARGVVERRRNPADRRAYALFLTEAGHRLLEEVAALAAEHERELCAGLTAEERETLLGLLRRMAAQQGLPQRVHPGLARPDGAAQPPC